MRKRIVTPCPGSADMTERYYIDDKEVSKKAFDDSFPPFDFGAATTVNAGNAMTGYPFKSDALAVHPDQIGEAQQDSVKKGVPTEFDSEGRAVIRSRQHKKEYCLAYGFHDRDAGYGDAQRGSFRGHY